MRPLIAITTTSYPGLQFRVPQVMLGYPYVDAIETACGASLLLTPAHSPTSLECLIGLADGLLLTGGEDVSPEHYGEDPHPRLGITNPLRDAMEMHALQQALQHELPVLAVCRGMQLLNVCFGGSLYQDLPSQRPGEIVHEQQAPVGRRWHSAEVELESRLARIFGSTELFINSFHHQGLKRVGSGLRPLARAEDGLIEAVEAVDYPWVFGVQWHPERGEAESPGDRRDPDRRLIYAFVEAAAARRSGASA
ncbi:gamma-glutamyl-gamma-aminobutyrate hydrolase family protein [soil metagenome]